MQFCPQLLPEVRLLRKRRLGQSRVHQNGILADDPDLLPRNHEILVPAQQTEQLWTPQQDQALQPCRGRVEREVVRPAA